MMPKKARTKRNEKIRKLAAEGYTRQQIARIVNMHPNSVASILRSYIVREELMEVPNSNPRVYYDPHVRAMGDVGAKTDKNDGSVENIAVLVERGFSDTLPRGGLPNGWVNMHISGIAVCFTGSMPRLETLQVTSTTSSSFRNGMLPWLSTLSTSVRPRSDSMPSMQSSKTPAKPMPSGTGIQPLSSMGRLAEPDSMLM